MPDAIDMDAAIGPGEVPIQRALVSTFDQLAASPINADTLLLSSFSKLGFTTGNLDAESSKQVAAIIKVGTDLHSGSDATLLASDLKSASRELLHADSSLFSGFAEPSETAVDLISGLSVVTAAYVGPKAFANDALGNAIDAGASITDTYRVDRGFGQSPEEALNNAGNFYIFLAG